MWTANAPALLMLLPCSCIAPGLLLAYSQPAPGLLIVCSCPAPDSAHPNFTAFIIISTLRLFSARREPPFMVYFCLFFNESLRIVYFVNERRSVAPKRQKSSTTRRPIDRWMSRVIIRLPAIKPLTGKRITINQGMIHDDRRWHRETVAGDSYKGWIREIVTKDGCGRWQSTALRR